MALVQQAAAWADEHKVSVKVPHDVEMNDKWLARSALQKAIRRGETDEALDQAARLWKIEEDYCWRALAVIAVEDIGFGNPETVLYSHLAQLKTFRNSLDAGRLLTALVASMCAGVKTRSCCELSIGMDMSGPMIGVMKGMSHWSNDELLKAFAGEDVGASYGALRVLKGQVPEGGLPRPKQQKNIDAVEEIMMQLPEPFGLAAVHAMRRPVDTMSLAMFQTTRLFLAANEKQEVEVVGDVFPTSIRIGKFKSEAYDMHTQSGKKAIKAFYTSLKKGYPELGAIDGGKAVKALGAAIFVEEGGLEDQRLLGGDLYDLMEVQDTTFLPAYGVPVEMYDRVRQIVRQEFDRLNGKRKWAFDL